MHYTSIDLMARKLMGQHGLVGWKIRFNVAKVQAGSCSYRTRTITLSKALMADWSEDAIRNTILHELAHALVGPGHGHDRVWQRKARAIGCTGDRCWSESDDSPALPPTWIGRCPNGHESGRFRKPSGVRSCGKCSRKFNPEYAIRWERNVAA